MNYSFYEMHHLMTVKEHDDFLKTKLTNVLTAFFSHNPIKLTKVYDNLFEGFSIDYSVFTLFL